MTFPKAFLDQHEYISMTQAAEMSGYSYGYISRLVSDRVIDRAPIPDEILVSVRSLKNYMELTPAQRHALEIAAEYDTVISSKKNHYGVKSGTIYGQAAKVLEALGYLEALPKDKAHTLYRITEKGKERAKKG